MKLLKLWLFISAGLITFVVVALFGLLSYDTHNAIACAVGGNQPAFIGYACKTSLLYFRSTESDLEELQKSGGIDYVLNGYLDPEKYELAGYFIEAGLPVDTYLPRPGAANQITPLHSAVLSQDAKRVIFLIKHGADKYIRSQPENETPLELAFRLSLDHPTVYSHLDAVIAALQQQVE